MRAYFKIFDMKFFGCLKLLRSVFQQQQQQQQQQHQQQHQQHHHQQQQQASILCLLFFPEQFFFESMLEANFNIVVTRCLAGAMQRFHVGEKSVLVVVEILSGCTKGGCG